MTVYLHAYSMLPIGNHEASAIASMPACYSRRATRVQTMGHVMLRDCCRTHRLAVYDRGSVILLHLTQSAPHTLQLHISSYTGTLALCVDCSSSHTQPLLHCAPIANQLVHVHSCTVRRLQLIHRHSCTVSQLQVDPFEDAHFVRVAGCACGPAALAAASHLTGTSSGTSPGQVQPLPPAAAAVADGRVREVSLSTLFVPCCCSCCSYPVRAPPR